MHGKRKGRKMKFQAHRGVSSEYPENTLPAFEAAVMQGYAYIETDPRFTKDGQCVLLHDSALRRTCCTESGAQLPEGLTIETISYEEALRYDAGLHKACKFKGTRIPLLTALLKLAERSDVTVKIDNRFEKCSDAQQKVLFELVRRTKAKVALTCSAVDSVKRVRKALPDCEIHYDGPVSESVIEELAAILRDSAWYVWLALDTPRTAWVKVPKASPALCAAVKQYAKLGIWILTEEKELQAARALGADLIETDGRLKPEQHLPGFVDCHTHSEFSHDAKGSMQGICRAAAQKRLVGLAVTDHCDTEFAGQQDVKSPIEAAAKAIREVREPEPLLKLCGVEMGEAMWQPGAAREVLSAASYDEVLGSVHAVRMAGYTLPYSAIDFSRLSEKEIEAFLAIYFADMEEMIETCDFDVLTHLTCPLRYINGKYQRGMAVNRYEAEIERILRRIIQKGIALEVNTSGIGSLYGDYMPHESIIRRYRELGGYLITLGSDAHTPERVGNGFEAAAALLKRLGFKNLYYYQRRIAVPYQI